MKKGLKQAIKAIRENKALLDKKRMWSVNELIELMKKLK